MVSISTGLYLRWLWWLVTGGDGGGGDGTCPSDCDESMLPVVVRGSLMGIRAEEATWRSKGEKALNAYALRWRNIGRTITELSRRLAILSVPSVVGEKFLR